MAVPKTTTVMLAEFERFAALPENVDRRLELVDGEIIEVSPKLEHGLIASIIHGELYVYLKQHPIGRVMFEVDHQLADDDQNKLRPDVSFIANARLKPLARGEAVPLMPDLAVEVKSPSNYLKGLHGLHAKALYYLTHGARLVWLIYPDRRAAEVCTLDDAAQMQREPVDIGGILDGRDVLPGFRLAMTSLFEDEHADDQTSPARLDPGAGAGDPP